MNALAQSYVHGASAEPLIGETIGALLDRIAAEAPDSPALVMRHQNIRWNYRQLRERVDDLAAGLIALGLEVGDRIGIWSPNNAEWGLTQFAAAKAGLILVNINPAYRIHEFGHVMNKVGCRALILSAGFKGNDYLAALRALAPELDSATPGALKAARLPQLEIVIRLGEARPAEPFIFVHAATPHAND